MTFRVTPQTTFLNASYFSRLHGGRTSRLQQQISSGERLTRPSDDPLAQRTILDQTRLINRFDTLSTNIETARSQLHQTEVELRDANDLLVRARTIALQARQETETAATTGLAGEVDGLLDRLISIANAKHEGQYLFAGIDTRTQPFSETAIESGQFRYNGAQQEGRISLDTREDVDVYAVGSEVFASIDRGATIFIGTTGAQAGTGTDSGRGQGELIVRHAVTTFTGGSGIAAGVSSADEDTIIGPVGINTLTIVDTSGTGTFGTVTMNGGLPIDFTNADTDLVVRGPSGEEIRVDTTTITPGFSGTVDIAATGTLSVDGGLSEVPIDFTNNQLVTHAETGHVVNVDTTDIIESGRESLEFSGTADTFAVLMELRDDILNTRNLSPSERDDAFARRIDALDRVGDHFLSVIGDNAVSLQRLDRLQFRTEDLRLEAERRLGEVGAADVGEAVLSLQQEQSLYQFTLAVTARLFDTSLLNFLN